MKQVFIGARRSGKTQAYNSIRDLLDMKPRRCTLLCKIKGQHEHYTYQGDHWVFIGPNK